MADNSVEHTTVVHNARPGTYSRMLDEELQRQVNANALTKRLPALGVETRESKRLDKQYYKIFFVWFTCTFNILSFSAGALGPVAFGLGVKGSCLVIWLFTMLCAVPPAYFSTWGPRLGMRQMVQARYSFGYYGVIVLCVLNLIGLIGFCILSAILGGQTLAAVADGNLSWTVGIVIISIISLIVSFFGYDVLNWYERVAWFPVLIVYLVALGVGGKNLSSVPPPEPVTAARVLSFASTIAGFISPLTIEAMYQVLICCGLEVLVECFGAAVAATAPSIPSWAESSNTPGGLLLAMLTPAGHGFAKFLTLLLALSVTGNIAVSFYSITLNAQLIPKLVVIPRYAFSIAATAIVLPLSIVGAHRFYDTLLNFLSIVGYWASA
ncbi:hypothetical protein MPER_11410, partial [Moniliophthora perniciosa FA553]